MQRFGLLKRENKMIINANHYTLAVTDIEKSFHFYRDVLGLKPLCKWAKGAYFLVGDFWFCLNVDEKRKPEPDVDYSHFAFSVSQDDFSKMVSQLTKAGLAAFKENTSPGDSFYFFDPDGHRLEIHVGTWQSRLKAFKKERTGIEYFV